MRLTERDLGAAVRYKRVALVQRIFEHGVVPDTNVVHDSADNFHAYIVRLLHKAGAPYFSQIAFVMNHRSHCHAAEWSPLILLLHELSPHAVPAEAVNFAKDQTMKLIRC